MARHQAVAGWKHPVRIIAVTKGHGPDAVRAAHAAGVEDVGENRVQEAIAKQDQVGDVPVRWHLIGTRQGTRWVGSPWSIRWTGQTWRRSWIGGRRRTFGSVS